jgi:hypothetical protein
LSAQATCGAWKKRVRVRRNRKKGENEGGRAGIRVEMSKKGLKTLVHASIYVEGDAGHVGRSLRGEEDDRGGNLDGLAGTTHGTAVDLLRVTKREA